MENELLNLILDLNGSLGDPTGISSMITQANQVINGVVLTIAGVLFSFSIIQSFFGYKLMKIWIAISGFLLFGFLGGGIAYLTTETIGVSIFIGIITAIIGAIIAFKLYKAGVFILALFGGFLLGYLLTKAAIAGIAMGLIFGVISLFFVKPVLILSTSIPYGLLAGEALSLIIGKPEFGTVIGGIIAIIGTVFQFGTSKESKTEFNGKVTTAINTESTNVGKINKKEKCKKCNSLLIENQKFCMDCGTEITDEEQNPFVKETTELDKENIVEIVISEKPKHTIGELWKNKKIRYATIGVIALVLIVVSVNTHASNYEYVLSENGDGVVLTKYTGVESTVVIPEYIDKKKVVGLDKVFLGNRNLKEVTIPSTVTSIEEAFYACSELRKVTFIEPSSLTSLGESTFDECTNLTKIKLPEGLTEIGNYCFRNCTLLEEVNIPNGVARLDWTFNGCTNLKNIVVPSSVEYICGAFCECTNLSTVTLEEGLKGVGQESFNACTNLENIGMPNSVTELSLGAFRNCTSLKSFTIGAGITNIDNYVLVGCTGLQSLTRISSYVPFTSLITENDISNFGYLGTYNKSYDGAWILQN